jgi:hypothetical protein
MSRSDSAREDKLKKSWKEWLNEEVGHKDRTEAQDTWPLSKARSTEGMA